MFNGLIERHQILFAFSSVFFTFIIEYILFDLFDFYNFFITPFGILAHFILLIAVIKGMIFIGYVIMASFFLKKKYNTKNNIEAGQIYLVATAVITAFMLDDIWLITNGNIAIVILSIPVLFFSALTLNVYIKTTSGF